MLIVKSERKVCCGYNVKVIIYPRITERHCSVDLFKYETLSVFFSFSEQRKKGITFFKLLKFILFY